MTREEAKELLLHILMTYEPKDQYGDYDDPEPYEQALTMAIEALQAKTDGDLISRQAAIDELKAFIADETTQYADQIWNGAFKTAVGCMKILPSAEPETMDKTNANKIYNYLKEQIGDTVDDMKEFDAWFKRMVWHVKECNRLTEDPRVGLISIQDAVKEIHKYFAEEIDKTPTEIDKDGDELYADMPTVNSLLACNKELSKRIKSLPSAEPKTDDENELKFYYVESIDDYWIGARLDNFYYADWHEGLGFVWSHSRYLPWGEHIVDENTLWKEHTYPSEPIEIPFTEWIVGFVKKYFTEPKTGEWIIEEEYGDLWVCDQCGFANEHNDNFCPNCGAKMGGK